MSMGKKSRKPSDELSNSSVSCPSLSTPEQYSNLIHDKSRLTFDLVKISLEDNSGEERELETELSHSPLCDGFYSEWDRTAYNVCKNMKAA